MNSTLYFLRSSEQKIATEMLYYATRLDETEKTLDDFPQLRMYDKYYGLSHKDQGLYMLCESGVSGAAWIRLISEEKGSNAFVDAQTPILSIAVKPEFRRQGIAKIMLDQLLQEAGGRYKQISVSVLENSSVIKFFEEFGFVKLDIPPKQSPIDNKPAIIMIKELSKEEIVRPSDGYDPTRWMD